ncbi:sugar transferase [Thermodesulfobacteriota bacterium]
MQSPVENRLGRSVSLILKRVLDISLAVPILIVCSPVLAVAAVLIRVRMGAPVLFRQLRPGVHGKPFVLNKFRTMLDTRDESGELLPDKARLTGLGKFLRRTSIDELPQLWNVLRGELSLVGPRPLLMGYMDLYTPHQMRRHELKPGITGWAQVNGRNAVTWEERFSLDVWYVENRSLMLDMKILLMTLATVLRREGISQEGHVTMENFKGSREDSDGG